MKYNFIELNNKKIKIGIYSVYNDAISPIFVEHQKKVFDFFNIDVNQIKWANNGYDTHAEFLDYIINTEDVDYFIFFDIDCIPLKKDFLQILINRIYDKSAILGPEQITSHISKEITGGPYAAPSCFCISKDTYIKLGKPSFKATYRGDVAQELTHLCREKNFEIIFIKFEESLKQQWELYEGIWYGSGSTYEDLVYHNFCSCGGIDIENFSNKVKEIIYGK